MCAKYVNLTRTLQCTVSDLRLKDYKDVEFYQEQVLIIKIINANTPSSSTPVKQSIVPIELKAEAREHKKKLAEIMDKLWPQTLAGR